MEASSSSDLLSSVMAVSGTTSSALWSSTALSNAVNSTTASAVASKMGSALNLTTPTSQVDAQISRSWLGVFGRMTLFLIKIIPSILYWIISFASITLPTFLFNLFSTSLTFTMNATTLWVMIPGEHII